MTQEQYDKILAQKLRRAVEWYDRTTPLLYYGKQNTEEGKRWMRIYHATNENVDLFKARHSEFTATWLQK